MFLTDTLPPATGTRWGGASGNCSSGGGSLDCTDGVLLMPVFGADVPPRFPWTASRRS